MIFIGVVDAADIDNTQLFINIEADKSVVYCGESQIITVNLYSSTPDISGFRDNGEISLKKGSFESIKKVNISSRPYKKKFNGKILYCFPLETYAVSYDHKGNYEITDGPYEIGVSFPVIYNDPFWGPYRSSEIEAIDIDVSPVKVKVKSLPSPSSNYNFNGSVGNFKIETILPKGNIYLNEEATVYIVIKGEGILTDSTLPDYQDAFKDGLKLKSFAETRSQAYSNGNLVSEIQMECVFIPTRSEEVEIGEISFCYFDPKDGKYKTVVTKPVKVNVKSSVDRREQIPV